MGDTNDRMSAQGVYEELLNRAVGSPTGIAISYPTRAAAEKARFKCYDARKRFRRWSLQAYSPGDGDYNSSPWENLLITVEVLPDGSAELHIKSSEAILSTLQIREL